MSTRGKLLAHGVAWGIITWLVYAVVECILAIVVPLAINADTVVLRWHWEVVSKLLLGYAAAGIAAGALIGVIAGWGRGREADIPKAATLSLTLAVGWTMLNSHRGLSEGLSLALALFLAGAIAVSLRFPNRAALAGLAASAWFASLVLQGPVTISKQLLRGSGQFSKLALIGIWCGAAICGAVWLAKALKRRGRENPWLALNACSLIAIAAAGLGVALAINASRSATSLRSASVRNTAGSPNVVMIVMDTVRADRVYPRGVRGATPNLEKLAGEATLFTRFVATSDMTLPTHASIFTGLYPSFHGAHFSAPQYPEGRPLDKQLPTLAGILASNGYATAGVAANWAYLRPEFGLNRGFAGYDCPRPVPLFWVDHEGYLREQIRRLLNLVIDTEDFDLRFERAADVNATAFRLLGGAVSANRPFFLFLNYMDAHAPYLPPEPYASKYAGRMRNWDQHDYWHALDEVMTFKRDLAPREQQHLLSQYDGGIAYVDAQIGAMLARLRDSGVYDNSLIIVTSDHGETFGEDHLMEHGMSSVSDGLVRVPLIIKYPHQRQARRIDDWASQVDLMPTVLDCLGYKVPAAVQGRALNRPDTRQPPFVLSETFPSGQRSSLHARYRVSQRAVFSGSFKFASSSDGKQAMYNVGDGPAGSGAYPQMTAKLEPLIARVNEWLRSAAAPAVQNHRTSRGTIENLRSLGYVQ